MAIGADVDEYRVDVPAGQRSIRIEVGGDPVVGVRLQLLGPDGTDVPLAFTVDATSGRDVYLANVEPGTGYRLRVEQPPFSAVLMYDTSLSIAGYWRPITQGLMAFAGDVQRGRDRVMIIPFGPDAKPVLRDWSDDAYQLLSALEGNFADGDSSAEASVLNALEVLTARQGARAILLVTDGETSSFREGPRMWQGLAGQRPLIYAVHIGGTAGTSDSTHLLQDLAGSAGGAYTYVRTQDEMDRAFDRMATSLRRPAGYSLSYVTSADELPPPEPGGLSVVTEPGPDGEPVAAPIDPSIAVEIILDTSGSMRAKLGRTTRIAAAKEVLTRLVREELPPGIPVALRVFEPKARSCDTQLAVPLGPLDAEAMAATIEGLRTPRSVRTPLAAAIERVADDLAGVTGPRIVVVVSDGRESCGGDPEAAVRALRDQGFDVTVNVVGLGLEQGGSPAHPPAGDARWRQLLRRAGCRPARGRHRLRRERAVRGPGRIGLGRRARHRQRPAARAAPRDVSGDRADRPAARVRGGGARLGRQRDTHPSGGPPLPDAFRRPRSSHPRYHPPHTL